MTRRFLTLSHLARLGACAVLASLISPVEGIAQQQLTPVQIEVARSETENARADTLEEFARSLYSTPHRFREAAQLHRRAAWIRGDDPRAAASYRSAAWLYSATKDNGLATEMMVKAAEHAAMSGRIEDAANSYIDAALLAVANDREDKVPTLLSRVHTVLAAPMISADQRSKVLDRIRGDSRVAHLDTQRPVAP